MGRHVLLIEDEPNILEAMRFILARDGWTVSSHSDGNSAVAAVQRARPDVLVLDVMLPGRSALTSCASCAPARRPPACRS